MRLTKSLFTCCFILEGKMDDNWVHVLLWAELCPPQKFMSWGPNPQCTSECDYIWRWGL